MLRRILFAALALPCLLLGVLAALFLLISPAFSLEWSRRLAVSFDQLGNALAGGDEDETISSRAAKAARQRRRWGCLLCWLLGLIDPGHCEKSIEPDRGEPLPPEPVLNKPRKRVFHFWSF